MSILRILQDLRARLSNFIWLAKLDFFTALHRLFPSMHKYEWTWCLDCGCCGFEGVYCKDCNARHIIGTVAYSWPPIEGGDAVEDEELRAIVRREEAEEWLKSGPDVSGVLAWDSNLITPEEVESNLKSILDPNACWECGSTELRPVDEYFCDKCREKFNDKPVF